MTVVWIYFADFVVVVFFVT